MPRKTPLSWEEHLELGTELKDIRERLLKIAVLVPNRVGKASKAANRAKAALQAVGGLKCEMDSIVFKAFPDKDFHELVAVYYGKPEERPSNE